MPMALRPGTTATRAGDGAHRAGDVVGKADDARRLDAGRRLELVERDHRAGADIDDLALDAEIVEHALEQAGILLERARADRGLLVEALGLGEEAERRQFEAGRFGCLACGLADDALSRSRLVGGLTDTARLLRFGRRRRSGFRLERRLGRLASK